MSYLAPLRESPVTHLFGTTRPLAILWAIRSVVIDTLDRVCRRRARPHVFVERRERLVPSVAHDYATTAVVGESVLSWVAAPLLHALPHDVLGQRVEPVSGISCFGASAGGFSVQAPATRRVSVAHVLRNHVQFGPAIAAAMPRESSEPSWCYTDSSKPSETLPR